jgi:threonyl-tRNA synthetase
MPMADRHLEYSIALKEELLSHNIRSEVDERSERVGKKVHDAQTRKISLMLTIGDKEVEQGTVAIRTLDGKVKFGVKKEDFLKKVLELIKSKSLTVDI